MLRRKLWYLLLIAVSAVMAILYNTYIMAVLFLIVLLVPILLAGILWYLRRRVKVVVSTEARVWTKENQIKLVVQIVNPTIFPIPRLKIVLKYKHHYEDKKREDSFFTSVDSKSEQSLGCEFKVNYCGNVEAVLDRIYLWDFLEIFNIRRRIRQKLIISVLPEFTLLEQNPVKENNNVLIESELFSSVKAGDDNSEIFSIHEYKEGDRINHIHWKLSLKEDALMVKEFGFPLDCSVALFVELYLERGRRDCTALDKTLEAVLSLSLSMVMNKQQHYIAWFDSHDNMCKRRKIEKEEDLYETFSYLFESLPYDCNDAVIRYHAAEFYKTQYTNIFYITPKITDTALQELKDMRKNAWCHILYADRESSFGIEMEELAVESYGMELINIENLLQA